MPTRIFDQSSAIAVALLDNGSTASVWAADGPDGDGSSAGVFFRLTNVSGGVVVAKAQVNTNNISLQYDPDVTALSTGGFVVAWTTAETGNYDIKAQLYTALGQRVGGEILVDTNTATYNLSSSIAAFDAGGFVIVWTNETTVYAQRFLDTGAKDGGEIVVGASVLGAYPDVSTLANGGFVVTWARDDDRDGDNDIVSRVFGPATEGTTATAATEVIYGTSGADTLRAAPGAFKAGDQVDLLGGSDELRLTAAGTLDLTAPDVFAGVEKLVGTTGNDTFIVSQERLTGITAYSLGGGIDTFKVVGASFTLSAAANVARLATVDPAAAALVEMTGNSFDQHITGDAQANVLRGLGGNDRLEGLGGADSLFGGAGDDTFYVDVSSDQVFENVGEGTDTVYTLNTYALQAEAEIEILRTLDDAGTNAITLFGNEFGQTIFGNNGANVIDGGGGADIMRGLGGGDTYYVDNVGDRIVEAANGGRTSSFPTYPMC